MKKYRLDEFRDDILARLLKFVAVAGMVAAVPGIAAAVAEELWTIAIVDTLAYLCVAVVGFMPRMRFNTKLALLVADSMAVGAVVTVYTGPLGAGYIWFIVAVVMSALFGRLRVVVSTLVAVTTFMALWAVALANGLPGNGATPRIVAIIAASLLVACGLLAFVIRGLLRSLGDALDESDGLSSRLSGELEASNAVRLELESAISLKDELLRELQHRVRNNLQVVQSLLSGDGSRNGGDTAALDIARRRVRALSTVNDLYLSFPGGASVDARELVRTIAQGIGRCDDDGVADRSTAGSSRIDLDPQTAGLAAILLTDAIQAVDRPEFPARLRVLDTEAGLRIELRQPVGLDSYPSSAAFRELLDDRMTRIAAPELTLGLLESCAGGGPGLYLEAAAIHR